VQNVWPKIAEHGNSLQDKQWTSTGTGSMVPEEEKDENVKTLFGVGGMQMWQGQECHEKSWKR